MSQSNKYKEYQRLKEIWYKKLEDSGFHDIETDEYKLKVYSTKWARKSYVSGIPHKIEYYRIANMFLLEHTFDTKLDKAIWEYHTNGLGARSIATILKKAKIERHGRESVYQKIKVLRTIMLAKYVKKN